MDEKANWRVLGCLDVPCDFTEQQKTRIRPSLRWFWYFTGDLLLKKNHYTFFIVRKITVHLKNYFTLIYEMWICQAYEYHIVVTRLSSINSILIPRKHGGRRERRKNETERRITASINHSRPMLFPGDFWWMKLSTSISISHLIARV